MSTAIHINLISVMVSVRTIGGLAECGTFVGVDEVSIITFFSSRCIQEAIATLPRRTVAVTHCCANPSLVAYFVIINNTISAGLVRPTVRGAAITRVYIAIVTDLIRDLINNPIAADLVGGAIRATTIPRVMVTVIALLSRIPETVSAHLKQTGGAATVTGQGVAVIALLA
jgi:hypothetical protein